MIADTTFLIHFHREGIAGQRGPARAFFAADDARLLGANRALNTLPGPPMLEPWN